MAVSQCLPLVLLASDQVGLQDSLFSLCHYPAQFESLNRAGGRLDARFRHTNSCPLCFAVHFHGGSSGILGLLGGPWLMLHGPSSHYLGPHGCSSYPYCHQMIIQTHPKGDRGVSAQVGCSHRDIGLRWGRGPRGELWSLGVSQATRHFDDIFDQRWRTQNNNALPKHLPLEMPSTQWGCS